MRESLHLEFFFFSRRKGETEQTDIGLASPVRRELQVFCGGLWFLVGSASVFWKLLAGIRGDLTDGFLRESAAIQLRCVCVSEEEAGQEHMLRNGAQKEKKKIKNPSDVSRAVETLKTTEVQIHFSLPLSLRFTH